MANVSKEDVKFLLNFFSQKQSVENYENILREIASEYPIEFIDTVNKFTFIEQTQTPPVDTVDPIESSRNWCFVQNHILERVQAIWSDKTQGWELAKQEYIKHNPYTDEYTDGELKERLCKDIFDLFYHMNEKVSAIKFYREITGVGLKRSKEAADYFWDRKKNGLDMLTVPM